MGGYGSGRQYRGGGKTTTGSQHHIDIRWMRRQGYIRVGKWGELAWSSRGEQTGFINFRMSEKGMELSYRVRRNGGEWESIDQTITLDRTQCNFGGHRTWFLCTRCGKRIAVLYGAGRLFLCRHCYRLAYGSQQEGQADRLMRKARKIRDRLGAEGDLTTPIWRRPKGMHEKTYHRLRNEANRASQISSMLMLQRFKGMDCDLLTDFE